MTNQDYKNAALAALRGNWPPAVLASIVYVVLALVVSGGPVFFQDPLSVGFAVANGSSGLLTLLVLVPLEVGFYNAFVKLYRQGDAEVLRNSFSIAFSGWGHKVWTLVLMALAVMAGCILFFIPGIILAYAYSMVPYLVEKHPELSAADTLKASRQMMKGHKFDYFYLGLSFIGWILLSILTLGIGLFWLVPYMQTATAAFWEDVYSQAYPESE